MQKSDAVERLSNRTVALLLDSIASRIEVYAVGALDAAESLPSCVYHNGVSFGGRSAQENMIEALLPGFRAEFERIQKDGQPTLYKRLPREGADAYDVRMFLLDENQIAVEIRPSNPMEFEEAGGQVTRNQSERLLKTVFDGIDAGLAVRDPSGHYLYANPAYAEIAESNPQDIVGKTAGDFFSPEQVEAFRFEDQQIVNRITPGFSKRFVRHKNGEIRHHLMRKNIINLGVGLENCVCVFAIDVTEQRLAEQERDSSNERYRQLFNTMSSGFSLHEIIVDEQGMPVDYRYLEINPAFEQSTGLRAEEVVGKTIKEILPDIEPYWIEMYGKVALTGETVEFEQYAAPLGRYYSVTAFSPDIGQFAVLSNDVTERKKIELALYEEKEKLRVTLTSIGDGVIATDRQGRVELMNIVAEEMTGWTAEEALGKRFTEVFPIFNEITGEIAVNPIEKVFQFGKNVELANHTALQSRDGTIRSIADSAAPIQDKQGNIHGAILVFRDVTMEKRRVDRIAFLSYHDTLTGLHNRNFLDEQLIKGYTEFKYPVAVVMGDVNGLKLTNDIFGHKEGDRLLQAVANILRSNCKPKDILVRWAGDEFVMIMPETSMRAATSFCKKIAESLERFDALAEGIVTPPSISLGFAIVPDIRTDILHAIKQAEDSMYKRKLLESRSAHSAIITSLKKSLFEKSNETEEHAERLADLCCKVGFILDLTPDEINDLHLFALLHDIGKIAVSDHILNKPSSLTEAEWEEMKRHPEIGYRICQCTTEFRPISEYILTHHERWDGTGYAQGLKGEQIPIQSRILAVVDAYDAMTTNRPYRRAVNKQDACKELSRCSGTQFDPTIVDIFLNQVIACE